VAGPINLVVEGVTDAAVARRLLDEASLVAAAEYVKNGKSPMDKSLAAYNSAARFSCWLVLRDLDHDEACAPELRKRLLPEPSPHMRFHVPVRAVEAWLLADAVNLSRFLAVGLSQVPSNPDALDNPKVALVNLARKSRKRTILDALVPAAGSTASVGPGYAASLIEFASAQWRPELAAQSSESLARLRSFLRRCAREQGQAC